MIKLNKATLLAFLMFVLFAVSQAWLYWIPIVAHKKIIRPHRGWGWRPRHHGHHGGHHGHKQHGWGWKHKGHGHGHGGRGGGGFGGGGFGGGGFGGGGGFFGFGSRSLF